MPAGTAVAVSVIVALSTNILSQVKSTATLAASVFGQLIATKWLGLLCVLS